MTILMGSGNGKKVIKVRREWPFNEKPLLVFWETTKACLLACKHCRAESIKEHLPGTLSLDEGLSFIDQIIEFKRPYPILIFTGGDLLMRSDIWELLEYAISKKIPTAVSPSVTPLLTKKVVMKLSDIGIKTVSISLDAPFPEVHDNIRGIPGTFKKTIKVIRWFNEEGIKVQINTIVMRENVMFLADLVKMLLDLDIRTWEVFYLIPIGRAGMENDLKPIEWEDVSHFLYDASKYGITIRTVEGPMFRRIVSIRRLFDEKGIANIHLDLGPLYRELKHRLNIIIKRRPGESLAQSSGTRDGKGVIFVSYNGLVYPSGFLTYALGNIREEHLKKIYIESEELRKLRSANFKGKCGKCEFRDLCGGSRARAYAYFNDMFAEDPACPYTPGKYLAILKRLGIDENLLISTSALIHDRYGRG